MRGAGPNDEARHGSWRPQIGSAVGCILGEFCGEPSGVPNSDGAIWLVAPAICWAVRAPSPRAHCSIWVMLTDNLRSKSSNFRRASTTRASVMARWVPLWVSRAARKPSCIAPSATLASCTVDINATWVPMTSERRSEKAPDMRPIDASTRALHSFMAST